MTRLPPSSTRNDTSFPYTTLCRSRRHLLFCDGGGREAVQGSLIEDRDAVHAEIADRHRLDHTATTALEVGPFAAAQLQDGRAPRFDRRGGDPMLCGLVDRRGGIKARERGARDPLTGVQRLDQLAAEVFDQRDVGRE